MGGDPQVSLSRICWFKPCIWVDCLIDGDQTIDVPSDEKSVQRTHEGGGMVTHDVA
jgi:hypothetical protein